MQDYMEVNYCHQNFVYEIAGFHDKENNGMKIVTFIYILW